MPPIECPLSNWIAAASTRHSIPLRRCENVTELLTVPRDDADSPQPPNRTPVLEGRRPRPGLALAVLVTCQLMVVLDSTVVTIALPSIQQSLHFSATDL